MLVGHEVMRISATDIDDGNNSLVYYELEAKSVGDEGFFRIDNGSGIIFLNKNINVSYSFFLSFFMDEIKFLFFSTEGSQL